MSETNEQHHKFGTFIGVYTPSLLTILGVIMYLRFGWMVGNAGLIPSLLIVILCSSITLITALSMSSIATNMHVGVGGEYFLLSRSLGLEMGGAIGVPLFLARTASITLYSFGLAESLRFIWPDIPIQLTAAIIVVLLTVVSGKSAGLALKMQIPLMIAVGISIVVLAVGVLTKPLRTPQLWGTYPDAAGFWVVLAVYFPAVTGFSAGVGMSGDLKDPGRSIPIGTISAVLTGFIIYAGITILLSIAESPSELVNNSLLWMQVAIIPFLIIPGMWGAILSSGVGSILGGPRVLQSLSNDKIMPGFLSRTTSDGQPRTATWMTGALALLMVMLGDLNAVAPFVTIFFLTLYIAVNLVAALESRIGGPSFRPRIKIPWLVSLSAALGAIIVMFLLNKIACIIAIAMEIAIWFWLRRRAMKTSFGDLRRGLWISAARRALTNLQNLPSYKRDWRPNILLFAGDVRKRLELVRLGLWLGQNRGILNVCNLVEQDIEKIDFNIEDMVREINAFLHSKGMTTFNSVHVVPSFDQGVKMVIQASGIGELVPNTVMFGWSEKRERLVSQLKLIRPLSRINKSLLICRIAPRPTLHRTKQIDIWWRGKENNGDMMLLFAYLLSLNLEWQGTVIAIKSVVESDNDRLQMEESLKELIPSTRIQAYPKVIVRSGQESFNKILENESREAELTILGLASPELGQEELYAQRLNELVTNLGTVIFVKNSSEFTGKLL